MVEKTEQTPPETSKLVNKRVAVEIDPLGAFITSLLIDGQEVIYQPKATKPNRGGIPILGPTPGPIKGHPWEHLYPNMPNHGSDRTTFWSPSKTTEDELVLTRTIDPKEFLFAGQITVKFKLLKDGISLSKTITNRESKPREIGHGFHPYFTTGTNAKYSPDAIDNLFPLTPGKSEIIKPGVPIITMSIDENLYSLTASPDPIQTVVWSDNPGSYACLEPWWAEVGQGDIVGPNETKIYNFKIQKINPPD